MQIQMYGLSFFAGQLCSILTLPEADLGGGQGKKIGWLNRKSLKCDGSGPLLMKISRSATDFSEFLLLRSVPLPVRVQHHLRILL